MFKVIGIINGETESIEYSWENGHGSVSGDPMAMFLMRNSLERTTPVGPVGQYMDRDIDEPLAALFMIKECFETVLSCEGDVPQAAEIPNNSIC